MTWVEGLFLGTYFFVLLILSLYGSHRYVMAYLYYKYKGNLPTPKAPFETLPRVTIQLPIFNEMYVVERLIEAVCRIEYPRALLEIQLLDDSTDETQGIARAAVDRARAQGHDIAYLHRDNRKGYKAGALQAGLHGYVPKTLGVAEIVSAFQKIMREITNMPPNVLGINRLQGRECCRWKVHRSRFALSLRLWAAFSPHHQVRKRKQTD